mmetsp:Transcript_69290/g.225741  ORF Transcript_69290/g.225741 Transcript_69290/m.225741 type:complete len:199 (+) Transcript_69290:2303-2899(+)
MPFTTQYGSAVPQEPAVVKFLASMMRPDTLAMRLNWLSGSRRRSSSACAASAESAVAQLSWEPREKGRESEEGEVSRDRGRGSEPEEADRAADSREMGREDVGGDGDQRPWLPPFGAEGLSAESKTSRGIAEAPAAAAQSEARARPPLSRRRGPGRSGRRRRRCERHSCCRDAPEAAAPALPVPLRSQLANDPNSWHA